MEPEFHGSPRVVAAFAVSARYLGTAVIVDQVPVVLQATRLVRAPGGCRNSRVVAIAEEVLRRHRAHAAVLVTHVGPADDLERAFSRVRDEAEACGAAVITLSREQV